MIKSGQAHVSLSLGMFDNAFDDFVPMSLMQLMAATFQSDKFCSRYRLCEQGSVFDWKYWISRAVDDKKRRLQLAQPAFPCLPACQHEMIGDTLEVCRTVKVALDEVPRRLPVMRISRSSKHTSIFHNKRDHLVAIGPIHFG